VAWACPLFMTQLRHRPRSKAPKEERATCWCPSRQSSSWSRSSVLGAPSPQISKILMRISGPGCIGLRVGTMSLGSRSTHMPLYFFNVQNGIETPDHVGTELPDKHAAWAEATKSCGDLIRNIDGT
jgi:hypothetical protein